MTPPVPEYDLLLAIQQHRLRYLGHILRMPESRVVGSALGQPLWFKDFQEMDQLVALAKRRGMHWPNNCTETDYHCTIGPPGSEMEYIHRPYSKGLGVVICTLCEFNRISGDARQGIRYLVVPPVDVAYIGCVTLLTGRRKFNSAGTRESWGAFVCFPGRPGQLSKTV